MKSKTIIIAEAGVNHNGDIEVAKKLIDIAALAGADYIKFQSFKAEKLVTRLAKKADYQIKNFDNKIDSQFEMLKNLELSDENHFELYDYCESKKINFLSTAFDLDTLDFLKKLNLKIFKIPSGEITNLPYLQKVARLADSIILSTGMSTISEIESALLVIESEGFSRKNITILHCTTEYPTPMQDVNLKSILTMKDHFKLNVGYSDHSVGIEVPIAAVALGACIIEKHFTLNKNMSGPDHIASIEPEELINMVSSIRNVEIALGDGNKKPSNSEIKNIVIARKSIHANANIKKDEVVKMEHLIMLRPGSGISPMDCDKIIGKTANREILKGEMICINDLS